MSPAEIVKRVKDKQLGPMPQYGVIHDKADIDHLLAIHDAVIEFLDARYARNTRGASAGKVYHTRTKLSALCGWKPKT